MGSIDSGRISSSQTCRAPPEPATGEINAAVRGAEAARATGIDFKAKSATTRETSCSMTGPADNRRVRQRLDMSAEEAAALPFQVPDTLGRTHLRVPVLARARQLLTQAGVPVTPRMPGMFALDMAVQGVSKTSAITEVLSSGPILASIGLTAGDIAARHTLEVWGTGSARPAEGPTCT